MIWTSVGLEYLNRLIKLFIYIDEGDDHIDTTEQDFWNSLSSTYLKCIKRYEDVRSDNNDL